MSYLLNVVKDANRRVRSVQPGYSYIPDENAGEGKEADTWDLAKESLKPHTTGHIADNPDSSMIEPDLKQKPDKVSVNVQHTTGQRNPNISSPAIQKKEIQVEHYSGKEPLNETSFFNGQTPKKENTILHYEADANDTLKNTKQGAIPAYHRNHLGEDLSGLNGGDYYKDSFEGNPGSEIHGNISLHTQIKNEALIEAQTAGTIPKPFSYTNRPKYQVSSKAQEIPQNHDIAENVPSSIDEVDKPSYSMKKRNDTAPEVAGDIIKGFSLAPSVSIELPEMMAPVALKPGETAQKPGMHSNNSSPQGKGHNLIESMQPRVVIGSIEIVIEHATNNQTAPQPVQFTRDAGRFYLRRL